MEIWKSIAGYENYQISITGKIRKNGYFLKPYKNKKNDMHLKIKLSKDGKRKAFFVHQLVAKTFIPNPDNLPEINHIDHDPNNNSVTNLEWITHADNCKDIAVFRKTKKLLESPHFDFVEKDFCKNKRWVK